MAKQYFKSTPTIGNLWEGLKHAWNGWVDPKSSAIMGEPTFLPGKFPKLQAKYGLEEGTKYVLSLAKDFLKKDKLQTYIGNNGQQYVKTPNGVKSLINYAAEKVEQELNNIPTYGDNLWKHHAYNANKNAQMIKERFGSTFSPVIKYIERTPYNPNAPRVKKVESLYSKHKAFDANQVK